MTVDELQAEMTRAREETPLPPGATWKPISINANAQHEVGSGRNMVQFQAMCQWDSYWVAAISAGDQPKMAIADEAVSKFVTWHVYTSSDPSFQHYLDSIAQRARLGDVGGLQEMIANNC